MNTQKNQENVTSQVKQFTNTSTVWNVSNILTSSAAFVDAGLLFITRNKFIPNRLVLENIDCLKALPYLKSKIKNSENAVITNSDHDGKVMIKDIALIIQNDLMLSLDIELCVVQIYYSDSANDALSELSKELLKYQKKKSKTLPEIHVLIAGMKGYEIKRLTINKPKLQIADNYNDDLIELNDTILKRLSRKNDKGLVLLHGVPGTGKTSYIRFLMSKLRRKKEIIFLPPNMARAITNPDLLKVLINHPNSIFIIEDAENIVMDRERNEASPVSAILNLADGILSDCLNVQIICSFNTELSRIDNALLRKGRLIARYEFKELALPKAIALSKRLGFQTEITKPMTLAAIYNQEEKEFSQLNTMNRIGFVA